MRPNLRNIKILVLGVFACLNTSPALSLDLINSYQLALENDREFSAARNTFEAVKQSQRQAKGQYYPTLNVSLEHIETEQQINRSDNEVFGQGLSDFPTDDLTVSLTQPIFRWDFISDRRVAKAEVLEAEYQFVAAEQELVLRTAEAYLLALAANDNEFVTRSELEAVEQQLKLAEKRLDVGLASPAEVHESQARFQLNQAEVIVAENDIVSRNESLRTITGSEPGDLMPLLTDFEMAAPDPADPEMWVERAMESNLAVKAREAALQVAAAEHKRQQADRYPTLGLTARFNNRDTGGSLFGGGSDVDTEDIVLRADWTVFQGGVLRARIKEALYNKQRAEDDLELERNNVRRDTRNAYLGVVSSIARANALKASLDAQELTVQAKQKGFETGSASNIEVLDAKRDFFFVQRDYLKARYDYLLSLLNLKRQVGSLSPEDLEKINGLLSTASVQSVSELKLARNHSIPAEVQNASEVVETSVEQKKAADDLQQLRLKEEAGEGAEKLLEPAVEVLDSDIRHQLSGHRWLFEIGADRYSNQLATLHTIEQAKNYIDRSSIVDSYYFRSTAANGETMFYVLAGDYKSLASAKEAANAAGLSKVWTRQISNIQNGRCQSASSQRKEIVAQLRLLCQQRGLVFGEENKGNQTAMNSASNHTGA